MALGYEGYVKIGALYALGTGTSVPRARARLDSSGGYGGEISNPYTEIGIGAPHVYDWEVHDGSVDFEVTNDMFAFLKGWVYDRDSQTNIQFSTRKDNLQEYVDTFWNSISISTSEGSLVDGSIGFVAIERYGYAYGETTLSGYINNNQGKGFMCPPVSGMPAPLNHIANYNPVPYWNTKVSFEGEVLDFTTWTLDFSQDVVKFFACNRNASPQAPMYVGVGPMTVTLSGSWMWVQNGKPTSYPADNVGSISVQVAGTTMNFQMAELQSNSDDVVSADSMTPIQLEYAIYKLGAP